MAEFINVQRDNGNSVDQAERDQLPDWQSAAGANNRERSRPRFDWRVALAVTLFIGGAGIWLTIRFVQFVASASQQTSWLDGYIVAALKLTPLLIIGCVLFWLREKAANARIVRLQNNMPVARHHVESDAWAGVAVGSLNGFYQVQNTWAAHSDYRSLNQLDMSSTGAAKASDAPALPAGDAPLPVVPVNEWMGWMGDTPHVLFAAKTKGGKSTTAKAILAPRVAAREDIFVIDPHSSEWFDLPGVGGGENWPEVAHAMGVVIKEYTTRLAERERHKRETGKELPVDYFPRLTVLLDEANNTRLALDVGRQRGTLNIWQQFAQILGSGARKVNISILLLCQSANVDDLGVSGSIRENFTWMGLDARTANFIIQDYEKNVERRKGLYAAIAGRDFPAVAEYKAQVYVLDRTGLDKGPEPASAAACAWELGYASVRDWAARTNRNGAIPTDGRTDALYRTPSVKLSEQERMDALIALRRQGVKREDAREHYGMIFENDDWTRAGGYSAS